MRKRKSGRQIIGLKVTKSDPLDSYDPTVLATQLAQQIQGTINHTNDSRVYAERAVIERKKAAELRELIEEVQRRRNNGSTEKVSRMDPLDSYDPGALATQADQHERNADQFERDAIEYTAKAEREQKNADKTQALIRQVRARRKQRIAEGD